MLSILESRSLYASISYLKSQKAPVADWLHDCGLPPSLLDQVESRVPSVGWWKLLEFAASKLENDQLGVDIEAQDRGFSLMNQFGSAIYQNKTLASCWHEVAKLSQTQSSNAALSLSTTEKGLWLLGTGTEQRVENYPQIEQLVVCNFIRLGRFKLGEAGRRMPLKSSTSKTNGSSLSYFQMQISFYLAKLASFVAGKVVFQVSLNFPTILYLNSVLVNVSISFYWPLHPTGCQAKGTS